MTIRKSKEYDLIKRYQRGSVVERRQVGGQLLEMHQKFIRAVARKYACQNISEDDLFQIGAMALLHCVDKFKLSKKLKLLTYAGYGIRRKMQRACRTQRVIALPNTSFNYLAEHLKKPYLKATKCYEIENRKTVEFDLDTSIDNEKLLKEVTKALETLSPRTKDVLLRRMDGETLKSIGESYGVSRERVRQIYMDAVEKIKEQCTLAS